MIANYTIYQQALDLQASGFNHYSSFILGVGVAKFMQILLPQLAFLITASIVTPPRLLPLTRRLLPGRSREAQIARAQGLIEGFHRLQGFFVWKLACDLGFFLIVTEYGSWLRAFTLSGLVTYTALQYVVYYLIGQRLILARCIRQQPTGRPKRIRTTWWKNLAAKLFYEEMGVTISQVSGAMIAAKFLVDYSAMWITWSAYTVAFFFFGNGGLGFSPYAVFPHVFMISLYVSVYLGYAFMFTTLEILLKNIALRGSIPLWSRKLFLSTQFKQLLATVAVTLVLPALIVSLTGGWKSVGEWSSQLTGVLDQWTISLDDNPPQWKPGKPMIYPCDSLCLQHQFLNSLTMAR